MQQKISIVIDGQHVSGTITFRTSSDLCVEIDHPFSGVHAVSHVPYFARRMRSFSCESGDLTAKCFLEDIYSGLLAVDEGAKGLKLSCADINKLERFVIALTGLHKVLKARLRHSFKSGDISQQAYQQALQRIRENNLALEITLDQKKADFLASAGFDEAVELIGVDQTYSRLKQLMEKDYE